MKTVTVTTTWAPKQWNAYARRCVEGISEYWPTHYKKLLYPDDDTQRVFVENSQYFTLKDNSIHQAFINKHKVDISQHEIKKNWSGWRDPMDAVRFSFCVFNQIDAFAKCTTDILVFIDADVITFDHIPDGWIQDLMCGKDVTYIGRKNKFSETGFIAYDLSNANMKTFFKRWTEQYTKDLVFNLDNWGDADTFDEVRSNMVNEGLITDNNINDGRFHGLSGGKHPFINSELGRYMDHLKGEIKFKRSSKDELKYNWEHPYWQ